MKTISQISSKFGLLIILSIATVPFVQAQSFDAQKVADEIREVTLEEQSAFKVGACDEVVDHMAEDITFFPNGRKAPSKAVVERFCEQLPRPFGKLTSDILDTYALSATSGFAVRQIEYNKDEQTKVKEVVTKIWKKTNGAWKMQHLQSTVTEIPRKK